MQGGQIQCVDATQMGQAIGATGKVAPYGIQFDFDRADIKPESRPTLKEMAKFLRANPGIGLIVAGETDSRAVSTTISISRAAAPLPSWLH